MKVLLKKVKRYILRIFYNEVLALGDSHAGVFKHPGLRSAFPGHFFTVVAVGGATASGLENPDSKTQAYAIFKKAVAEFMGNTVVVMLGEVDTGFVIWYRAKKYNRGIQEMADRAVEVYSRFLGELAMRFRVLCISTPLPTIKDGNDWGEVTRARREVQVSQLERTALTLEFNRKVKSFCEGSGIAYISLDEDALGENGLVKEELLNPLPTDHHYDGEKFAGLLRRHLEGVFAESHMSGRIKREKLCIEKMVGIYCRGVHGTKGGLCTECSELLKYADARIDKCPFGPKKSTCAKCTIHCYKKDMRARIKEVMRYAGPRMSYSHPWLSLMHYLDGFKRPGKKA